MLEAWWTSLRRLNLDRYPQREPILLPERQVMKIASHHRVAIASWIQRGVTIFGQILCIRFLTQGLGLDNYSAFALLTSLIGWCALCDFGLAGSLQNYISECRGKGQSYDRYLFAAWALAVVVWVICFFLILIVRHPLSHSIMSPFSAFVPPDRQVLYCSTALLLGVSWSISIISFRVWTAEHRGYIPAIIQTAAALVSMLLVWLVNHQATGEKFLLSLWAYFGPMTLLAFVGYLSQAGRAFAGKSTASIQSLEEILARGGKMWIITVLTIISTQTDLFVVSRVMTDPKQIVIYNFSQKIFNVAYIAYNSLLLAGIPVISEMIHRAQNREVRRFLRLNILVGMTGIILFAILSPFFLPSVIHFLSPREAIAIPFWLTILFAAAIACRIWVDSFCATLMSANRFRFFIYWLPVYSIIGLAAQFYLGRRFGLFGVLSGSLLGMLATLAWSAPLALERLLAENNGA